MCHVSIVYPCENNSWILSCCICWEIYCAIEIRKIVTNHFRSLKYAGDVLTLVCLLEKHPDYREHCHFLTIDCSDDKQKGRSTNIFILKVGHPLFQWKLWMLKCVLSYLILPCAVLVCSRLRPRPYYLNFIYMPCLPSHMLPCMWRVLCYTCTLDQHLSSILYLWYLSLLSK